MQDRPSHSLHKKPAPPANGDFLGCLPRFAPAEGTQGVRHLPRRPLLVFVSASMTIFFVAAFFLAARSEAQALDAGRPLADLGSSGGERADAPEQAGGNGGGRAAARPTAAPVNAPVGGTPARGTARGTVGLNATPARHAPTQRGVAGGTLNRPAVDAVAPAVVPAQERVAPPHRRTARANPQGIPAGFVNDRQANRSPIRQQVVRPAQERVAPIRRQAVEPVAQTIKPVRRTVEPVFEPAQRPVAPVVEPVFEPVHQVTGTVNKTAEPVLHTTKKAVEPILDTTKKTAEPVLKPVKETTDPVVEPLTNAVGPVVKPALDRVKIDRVKKNADPSVGPVLDSGKEALNTKPVALAGPARPSADPSAGAPMLRGEGDTNLASSSSPSSTPAFSAQALAKKMAGSSGVPLAETAQSVPSVGASHGPASASRASVAGDLGGTPLAHNNPAVEQRATPATASQHSAAAPSLSMKAAEYLPSNLGSVSTSTEHGAAAAQSPQSSPLSSPLPALPEAGNAPSSAASGSGGSAPYVGGVLALFLIALLGGKSVWHTRPSLRPDSVYGSIINQPG